MDASSHTIADELRTPRSAGIAGIIFAVLLGAVLILLRSAVPNPEQAAEWLSDPSRRAAAGRAAQLLPFAGIAFLWFIGVIRSLLGDREDKLFATVFLGSGILFVAMLFTATALTAGLIYTYDNAQTVSTELQRLVEGVVGFLLATLSIRMAGVFTLVVTNLGRRTGIVPRWLVVWGYATGAVLLLLPVRSIWIWMLFPLWVLVLSLRVLLASPPAVDERVEG